ncbi:MAG: hypothetical protein BGO49_23025 [Planctomycetales bacterium 71-10]|nr:MAG: hypothetical protein BGO49_23025 [Planctomycetales bacterium 71-10]
MQVELLKVFVASPGDVSEEREVVREVIDDLNRSVAQEKGVTLQVVGWETDARPAFGGDPQSLVNAQIADMTHYDLFVGILWDRFGTVTPRAGSGTEEEFDRAVESHRRQQRPEIMFYFCQRPTTFQSPEQVAQKGKVLEFRSKLQKQGLTWDYRGVDEFRRLLNKHLSLWLRKLGSEPPQPPPERNPGRSGDTASTPKRRAADASSAPTKVLHVSDSGAWVLLNNAYYKSQEVAERNDGTVEVHIAPINAEEDAALRGLRPGASHRIEPVPYAYKNDGFIARILSAELRSVAGKSVWIVTLRSDRDVRANAGMELGNFNGVSADEIAARRARLILLNESSSGQGTLNDRMLESMISGLTSDLRVTEGAFPKLWATFKKRPQLFLPAARLWSVFLLKASGACDHVLELTLGPIDGGRLHVSFRGRRHRRYSNVEAAEIRIEGDCVLMD